MRRLKAEVEQKTERLTANVEQVMEITTELAITKASKDVAEVRAFTYTSVARVHVYFKLYPLSACLPVCAHGS